MKFLALKNISLGLVLFSESGISKYSYLKKESRIHTLSLGKKKHKFLVLEILNGNMSIGYLTQIICVEVLGDSHETC